MKLILERSDALAALTRVTGVVARKSNVPILNNVLISAADNKITFRATDLDMEATTSCPAVVIEPGELTVDAGKLREVVASAAAGSEISMELDESDDPRLVVKSGHSRFKLPVIGADSFPSIPDEGWTDEIKIKASDIRGLFESTIPSASTEFTRYYLCGVYLHVNDGRLRTVATNGHHLTYRDGPKSKSKIKGEIIPSKAITEIVKAIKDYDGDVVFSVKDGRAVRLVVGDYSFVSKVVDGNFPDYKRVIPSDVPTIARLDSASVLVAIRRAAIAADDKIRSVLLDLSPGTLTVRARGKAEAQDEVEIEYDGEPITLSFNSGYVIGILERNEGTVEVRLSDAVSPTTWRAGGDDDGLTVLLPVRQGGNQ